MEPSIPVINSSIPVGIPVDSLLKPISIELDIQDIQTERTEIIALITEAEALTRPRRRGECQNNYLACGYCFAFSCCPCISLHFLPDSPAEKHDLFMNPWVACVVCPIFPQYYCRLGLLFSIWVIVEQDLVPHPS